jgi:dTDP-4-dehydrorhamnose 3,5-epimerase
MSRFDITDSPLPGLKLIQRKPMGDDRGFLARLFCADELSTAGWQQPIAQINHTCTARRGTVRGMHYQQPPHAEMKLVSCLRGVIWDVAVDLRADSPTFLQWHTEILSAENHRALLIPEGFAHGFQTLTNDVELLYCHSAPHMPGAEGGINPLDERLDIQWPEPITVISERDHNHPLLDFAFTGLTP